VVSENGPYIVTGGVPLSVQTIEPNREGFSWNWVGGRSFPASQEYHLCRCGQSKNKPFCDSSHVKVRFNGTETASRQPYLRQVETMDGPTMTLLDAEGLCAFARFCDPGGKIWSLIEKTDDPAARELVIREAGHCPGGRLVVVDKRTQKPFEPASPRPSALSRIQQWSVAVPSGSGALSASSRPTALPTSVAIESPFVDVAPPRTSRSVTGVMPAFGSTMG